MKVFSLALVSCHPSSQLEFVPISKGRSLPRGPPREGLGDSSGGLKLLLAEPGDSSGGLKPLLTEPGAALKVSNHFWLSLGQLWRPLLAQVVQGITE